MKYTEQNISDIKALIAVLHKKSEADALFLESLLHNKGANLKLAGPSGNEYSFSFIPSNNDGEQDSFRAKVERIVDFYLEGNHTAIKEIIKSSPRELDKGELCLFRFCDNDEELRVAMTICMKKLEGTGFKAEHRHRPTRQGDWPNWAYSKRSRARIMPIKQEQ